MKALFDTNVVLDALLAREPFAMPAARLLAQVDKGRLSGAMCATTVTTVFYIAAKAVGRDRARILVQDLIGLLDVAAINRATIKEALKRDSPDFEDDVIAEAAFASGADVIVTRDISGFPHAPCRVMTPDELLAALDSGR